MSAYFFLKEGGMNKVDTCFNSMYIEKYNSFQDFVKGLTNKKIIGNYIHFVPQYKFVCDKDGKILSDFIGRFENLDNDFQEICERLGVNKELPLMNKGKRKSDWEHYYSPQTKEMVYEYYKKDFEIFGYEK